MSRKIIVFDKPRTWKIADKEVEIKKIETNSYIGSIVVPKHSKLDLIHPYEAISNVIRNVALLQNATFIEADQNYVLARINDFVPLTASLIRTEWKIEKFVFDAIVYELQIVHQIPEELFYITSKIS